MTIHCNICNSTRAEKLFLSQNIHGRFLQSKSDVFHLYKCVECKNIFLGKVRIDKDYYKKYYSQNYYAIDLGNPLFNAIIEVMDRFSFWMKEKMILSNLKLRKNIQILDVGCGIGKFLNHLDNKKFFKYGVEINKKGAIEAGKKGITVYTTDFLKLNMSKKFDVITMWHVLEHLPQPQKAIDKVFELLDKNGIFLFAVPNSACLGFSIGKKYFYHLDSPRHLFIPNLDNLKLMLKKSRFRKVNFRYEFYDYPIDLLVSLRKSFIKYLIYPLYPFIKFFDKETLTVIAGKN